MQWRNVGHWTRKTYNHATQLQRLARILTLLMYLIKFLCYLDSVQQLCGFAVKYVPNCNGLPRDVAQIIVKTGIPCWLLLKPDY